MNVIVRREFELAYYDVAVKHINHHTTGAPFDLDSGEEANPVSSTPRVSGKFDI